MKEYRYRTLKEESRQKRREVLFSNKEMPTVWTVAGFESTHADKSLNVYFLLQDNQYAYTLGDVLVNELDGVHVIGMQSDMLYIGQDELYDYCKAAVAMWRVVYDDFETELPLGIPDEKDWNRVLTIHK